MKIKKISGEGYAVLFMVSLVASIATLLTAHDTWYLWIGIVGMFFSGLGMEVRKNDI